MGQHHVAPVVSDAVERPLGLGEELLRRLGAGRAGDAGGDAEPVFVEALADLPGPEDGVELVARSEDGDTIALPPGTRAGLVFEKEHLEEELVADPTGPVIDGEQDDGQGAGGLPFEQPWSGEGFGEDRSVEEGRGVHGERDIASAVPVPRARRIGAFAPESRGPLPI